MMKNTEISIVVVLYNESPKPYVFDAKDYNVILVDNTPNRNLKISGTNIHYIPLLENTGIAKALNVGFKTAKEFSSKWVLTMDQDSELCPDMIPEYIKFLSSNNEKIGLLAPLINMYAGEEKQVSNTYYRIDEAITSGSLISVEAFDNVGGFKEELFIDGVDFEFCWNLNKHGYSIYQLNSVVMQHQLGETKEYKLFGKHLFYVTNHNFIRRYYMTRNSLYIKEMYADIMPKPSFLESLGVVSLFKIIFFEKDVVRKLKAIKLGKLDFKKNKFGKYEHTL